MNPYETFLDLLIAAMKDAALEGQLTQLAAQIDPDGKGLRQCRIIVIPEKFPHTWPSHAPAGTPTKEN